ncbi:MFS transporter [Gimesia chilikensis]|uniref:MFS transporter n=1 Tax=Gimesia chilikensis TaxID=2605989 RepID=UPI0011EFA6EA|nr:MFS transporter [Gimesia chilikensis]KAA0142813.1 MFS transporter [Gimesia chilikensis]
MTTLSPTEAPSASEAPETEHSSESTHLSKGLTLLLATTVGMVVGNLYYMQPLLGLIAIDLGLSESAVGSAATLSLIGQSCGMLLILPLGDIFNRRPLILISVLLSICALLLVASADSLGWLSFACLALGLSTTGTHMTISLAASLATPAERGRVVGTVVGGLLTGLLLSRTISGVLGRLIDWQSIYYIAACMLTCLLALLWYALPSTKPQIRMGYIPLLTSLWKLFTTEKVLRESCVFGSLSFAAFSAFWMTLVFHLERPPLNYGSDVAGMLGLLAIGGALAAGGVGRLSDRFGARPIIGLFQLFTLFSFGILYFQGETLLGLGIGVVLMDLGIQAVHVGNQSRVYSLSPEARNRLGTIYIVIYFAGGALGAAVGVWSWTEFGWAGVCSSSALFMLMATLYWLLTIRRNRV